MAKVLPPPPLLLMLLLILTLSLRGAANTTLASVCRADIVVKKRQTRVIFSKVFEYPVSFWKDLEVKPGREFWGVYLAVLGSDGTHHTASFPARGCFPSDDWWAFSWVTWLYAKNFVLTIKYGTCMKGCRLNIVPRGLYNVSVEAQGTSSWREIMSGIACERKHFIGPYELPSISHCMESSTTMPTPAVTSTNIILPVVVAVVVAMVVAVVAVVVLACRKNRLTSSNEARLQPQPAAPSRHLQFTKGQGRTPNQDEEAIYYEILPDLSERRVVVMRAPQDSEKPVYDNVLPEHGVRPHPPVYENVPLPGGGASPHGLQEAPEVNESHIYATVL